MQRMERCLKMNAERLKMIKEYEILDEQDKKLVKKFIEEFVKKEKYESLRKEIQKRRHEIKKGHIASHEEIWDV